MYDVQTVSVQGSSMEVLTYAPKGTGPHPGVLLAMHFPGHAGLADDAFTLQAAERLCGQGYAVCIPFIFHWWPTGADAAQKRNETTDAHLLADLQAAYGVLCKLPNVDSGRIGIAGHCWGGRVAWLGACHMPEVRACAVFYGGRIKVAMGGDVAPIALAGQMRCKVAGFFGNDDQNPTPADVDDYAAALGAAGVPHVFHRYDGAGHAFQNFPTPDRYRHGASEDAWTKLLAFLREELA